MLNAWAATEDAVQPKPVVVRKTTRARLRKLVPVLLVAGGLLGAGWLLGRNGRPRPHGVLPGDFEAHEALLFAQPAGLVPSPQSRVFAQIVAATRQHVQVIVAVPDTHTKDVVAALLESEGISADELQFVVLPFDSVWIRDFGPLVIKCYDGGYQAVDADYAVEEHNPRFADERVPEILASTLGLRHLRAPVYVDGGNLLSNGAGLLITTKLVLERNAALHGYSEKQVSKIIRESFGANQIVYLDCLAGERSGHADMFATFTAPDTIVVAQCSAVQDPVNADILDRNAALLAQIKTASGPLKVRRVATPALYEHPEGPFWLSYTNVVYANGVILVPAYGDLDVPGHQAAMALYQELLPNWNVVRIDCMPLILGRGSLHCVTMNMYRTN